jgi:NAD(P)-dependent dehydrogenase (short-subunit alcohol dehydrogenase family)
VTEVSHINYAADSLLAGKVIVITGAASGIGKRATERLHDAGVKVVAIDRSEVVHDCAMSHQMDVSSEQDWLACVEIILDRFGQVDGLVNCAGIIRMGSVVETELKDFQSVLEVNVIGTFLAMKNILPVMLNKGEGSIVNISSTAGIAGAPGAAAYCASKGAVRMLSKSAALDALALPGAVRVNSLHPAMTETPMVQTIVDQLGGGASIEDQMRAQQPSGQFITPDAVVDAIVFLLGDGSRFVNGSEMLVDNGFTAQ